MYVSTHMYTFRAEYTHTHIFIHIYTHITYISLTVAHTHIYTHAKFNMCKKTSRAHRPQGSCPTLHSRVG